MWRRLRSPWGRKNRDLSKYKFKIKRYPIMLTINGLAFDLIQFPRGPGDRWILLETEGNHYGVLLCSFLFLGQSSFVPSQPPNPNNKQGNDKDSNNSWTYGHSDVDSFRFVSTRGRNLRFDLQALVKLNITIRKTRFWVNERRKNSVWYILDRKKGECRTQCGTLVRLVWR